MGGVSVRNFGKLFVVGSASYRRLSRPLASMVSTTPAAIAGSRRVSCERDRNCKNEIKCKGLAVVLNLFAEGVRWPREPPHARSQR